MYTHLPRTQHQNPVRKKDKIFLTVKTKPTYSQFFSTELKFINSGSYMYISFLPHSDLTFR